MICRAPVGSLPTVISDSVINIACLLLFLKENQIISFNEFVILMKSESSFFLFFFFFEDDFVAAETKSLPCKETDLSRCSVHLLFLFGLLALHELQSSLILHGKKLNVFTSRAIKLLILTSVFIETV